MVALQTIQDEMFDDIYGAFLDDGDRFLTKDDWRPLFSSPADVEPGHCGYALVDGSRVVGVLGMLFSERLLDERTARFCNLHSWYVEDEYRSKSLLLLRQALRLKDHTLTDFTPTERVAAISMRVGFRPLDAAVRILLPVGSRTKRLSADFEVTQDSECIEAKLTPCDLRLLHAHQVRQCEHFLVTKGDHYCYMVCSKVDRYFLPYLQIHYISNKSLFEQALPQIRTYLLSDSEMHFVAIEDRLVAGLKLPMSFRLPMQSRQLYRPCDVHPGEIDGLHSEVALLGLSTLPSLSHRVRRVAKRIGFGWMLPAKQTTLELSA
jgi:hypothetical protein